jgi:AcrR family transcriptional regulator
MPDFTTFFSRSFFQTARILYCMAQPEGTTIEALCRRLNLNRRSVFRLLKNIEHRLKIPVIASRKVFGGAASYRLSPDFMEKLHTITLPEFTMTFNQAIFVYLMLHDDFPYPETGEVYGDIEKLRETLKSLFKQ